ncbi:methyltransferase, partial [Streptomyces sp. SID625]|nr:methyltransferase [Streptomyces sp. SID625]
MSDSQLWDDVDAYFSGLLSPEDESLRAAQRDSDTEGLPRINV